MKGFKLFVYVLLAIFLFLAGALYGRTMVETQETSID